MGRHGSLPRGNELSDPPEVRYPGVTNFPDPPEVRYPGVTNFPDPPEVRFPGATNFPDPPDVRCPVATNFGSRWCRESRVCHMHRQRIPLVSYMYCTSAVRVPHGYINDTTIVPRLCVVFILSSMYIPHTPQPVVRPTPPLLNMYPPLIIIRPHSTPNALVH